MANNPYTSEINAINTQISNLYNSIARYEAAIPVNQNYIQAWGNAGNAEKVAYYQGEVARMEAQIAAWQDQVALLMDQRALYEEMAAALAAGQASGASIGLEPGQVTEQMQAQLDAQLAEKLAALDAARAAAQGATQKAAESANEQKSNPWPWIIGGIVLVLAAVGIALWMRKKKASKTA